MVSAGDDVDCASVYCASLRDADRFSQACFGSLGVKGYIVCGTSVVLPDTEYGGGAVIQWLASRRAGRADLIDGRKPAGSTQASTAPIRA